VVVRDYGSSEPLGKVVVEVVDLRVEPLRGILRLWGPCIWGESLCLEAWGQSSSGWLGCIGEQEVEVVDYENDEQLEPVVVVELLPEPRS
jgi:hypothetical protein